MQQDRKKKKETETKYFLHETPKEEIKFEASIWHYELLTLPCWSNETTLIDAFSLNDISSLFKKLHNLSEP